MVSDTGAQTVELSRGEWGSLSRGDQMRGIADADTPTHADNQLTESPNLDITIKARSGSRRSSVIDMWRKREMSSSCNNLKKPVLLKKSSSDLQFRHSEEKKELTRDEIAGLDADSYELVAAKRLSGPITSLSPTMNSFVSSPPNTKAGIVSPVTSITNKCNERYLWNESESSFDDGYKGMVGSFATSLPGGSPSTVAWPDIPRSGSDADASKGTASFLWGSKGPETDEVSVGNAAESPKRDPISEAVPVTPDDTDLPAFSDLKSKWAKFGERKIQARAEARVPAKTLSPSPLKATSNDSQRKFRSISRTHDDSSIDGELTGHVHAESEPHRRDCQLTSSSYRLQQPVLDSHRDNFPIIQEKAGDEPLPLRPNNAKKQGNPLFVKSTPAKKASTHMYVKERSNMPSKSGIQIDGNPSTENSNGPNQTSALPKRFLQRKLLMERQRRRSKGVNPGTTPIPAYCPSEDDTLNDAYETSCPEKDRQQVSAQIAGTNVMLSNTSPLFIGSTIPMQTFMAFGAEEEDLIGAVLGPRNLLDHPKFKPVQEECVPGFSRMTDSVDDQDSTSASLPSKSSLANRAQKTLRDKRNRTKPLNESPDRVSVPPKEVNYNHSNPSNGYYGDEMKFLDKEHGDEIPSRARRVIDRPNRPSDESNVSCGSNFWGVYHEPAPSATFDESVSASTTSHVLSTVTSVSDVTSVKEGQFNSTRSRDSLMDSDDIVTDQFVCQSNADVEAFTASFQSLSLAQFASDLKEEAGTVLKGVDFKKLSNNWNEGVAAASQSLGAASQTLNKLVRKEVVPKKKHLPLVPDRIPSPVEEIAIEVEYVEDSDDGEV